eukprot:m.256575 g.256575  ORF g.256575 m.256575 type:complete len:126 (+) comp40401_c0_seq8:145-522(+)
MYIQKSKQKLLFTSNARLRVDWLRWTSNEVTFSQKAFSSSPMPGESFTLRDVAIFRLSFFVVDFGRVFASLTGVASVEVTFSPKAFACSFLSSESLQCCLHCVTWPFFVLAVLMSILDAFLLHVH